jgi:anti-sigma regulatory factor (Ser/Thr protein kinase)
MPPTAMRERSVSCRYRRELTAPRLARKETREALLSWGLGDHVEVAEVIISELVTNAVCHGAGPVDIRIAYDRGQLRMEVHDDGSGRPVWRQAAEGDECGRGLTVVDTLTKACGGTFGFADDAGDGKTVYASVPVDGGQ